MATNSPYSQKVVNCRGRACAKCGYCRDWYWSPHGNMKSYTKRPDATCTASYGYGLPGYGPGCGGYCLCCLGYLPFGNLCARRYFGGAGYGHGGGITALNGYLRGGLNHHIETLSAGKLNSVDLAARRNRVAAAAIADIGATLVGFGNLNIADLGDGNRNARIALHRAHHDDGRLCECSDNHQ